MTPAGRELLVALPIGRGRGRPLADVLHALAVATRSGNRDHNVGNHNVGNHDVGNHDVATTQLSTRITVPRSDGNWIIIEAAPLIGRNNQVVVTLRPAGRTELSTVLLRSHGLTPRETRIALATLGNDTNVEIAEALFVSLYTVQDHLKSIFAKTGTRSRRELAMQMLESPRHAARSAGEATAALGLRLTPPD